ncbi:MAG: protease modulator HflC [Proteobacteria bacterium]|nr:protease modulator HflC [Pseudomonadota bacterium]
MRTVLVFAGLVGLLALAATSILVVEETEHVVITQFGRPVAVHSEAGLYAKLPTPIQRVTRVDKRILFTATPETELLTEDKKNVLTSTYLSWRIGDPVRYLTALRTREFAEMRLGALVQSELGSALGEIPFDGLVPAEREGEGLLGLESRVLGASARVAVRDYGIEIVSLGITRLSFPQQNLQSVFARMRAERERIAGGYRSEGRAEAQKIRAEADRRRAEVLAAAESEAARLRGEGEAEAARIYAEAYEGHESFYRFLRTLESYEKVLNDNTPLVLPADSPFLELLLSNGPTTGPRRRE